MSRIQLRNTNCGHRKDCESVHVGRLESCPFVHNMYNKAILIFSCVLFIQLNVEHALGIQLQGVWHGASFVYIHLALHI